MRIRESLDTELDDVMSIERAAFSSTKEAELVADLLVDPSAKPAVSLLAFKENKAVGHILFTKASLATPAPVSVFILAPLAVIPSAQGKGVGGALIEHGLQVLSEVGADLVFVLGHPEYYSRYGFIPASIQGFDAPYPIPEKDADAWMVLPLREGVIGKYREKVIPADILDKPELWQE
jgi:putative acetyltransferase